VIAPGLGLGELSMYPNSYKPPPVCLCILCRKPWAPVMYNHISLGLPFLGRAYQVLSLAYIGYTSFWFEGSIDGMGVGDFSCEKGFC